MDESVYLGFDFGLRRTGVAVGQRLTGTARPLETVDCRDGTPEWERIGALIESWRPRALIVGLPRHADGTETELTAAARRFGRRLEGRYRLPVHHVDEALSSHVAERRLGERSRGRRAAKRDIDSMAAAVILETWLAESHD